MPPGKPSRKTPAAETPGLFGDGDPAPGHPPDHFPKSWAAALGPEFGKPYYAALSAFVAKERAEHDILPPEPDVFNAFRYTPLDAVRVVILGQDPYPTPGHAHGLAFSVRPGVGLPGSLRNIYKELADDLGVPSAKHGYLVHWARQGILLVSAVLTVRAGASNSHANKGWETFTDAALTAVGQGARPVVFVLWGNYAQKKAALIDAGRHAVLKSAHPSPLSARAGFFGSKPFSKANAALADFGHPPVDWALPPDPTDEG